MFHTLSPFLSSKMICEIILVVPISEKNKIQKDLETFEKSKPIFVVSGGNRRQDSVKNGVEASNKSTELICIHDAARPFVTKNLIEKSILACEKADGAIVAIKSTDTIKYSESKVINYTIKREHVWMAQTPQTFWKKKLLKAFKNEEKNKFTVTDEASIMEEMGYKVLLVEGHIDNFKITVSKDWEKAERLIR